MITLLRPADNLWAEQLEDEIGRQTPERIEELVKIFIHGTQVSRITWTALVMRWLTSPPEQLEIGFWEMFPSQ